MAFSINPIISCLLSHIIYSASACSPQQFGYPNSGSTYTYSPPPYGPYSAAASKSRMASDTHTYVDNSNSVDDNTAYYNPVKHCVQHFADHSMACAMAFERRTPSSEPECRRICSENRLCKSFQFNSNGLVCDLFDVDPTIEEEEGEDETGPMSAFGADDPLPADKALTTYHRSRRFAPTNGIPSDNFQTKPPGVMMPRNMFGLPQAFAPKLPSLPGLETNCQPSLVQARGTTFGVMDPECSKPGSLPIDSVNSGSVESLRAPLGGANTVEVIPETPDCLDGARARVQLIDGISLVEERPIANIQLNSADICLHLCRSNAHLDGTRFSKPCKSVTFDRSTGRCEIIGDAISPNGELNYVPNPDSIYFEKFCVPESELAAGCDDVVHRIPQHTLDSRASGTGAVVSAQSQVECIRRCVTAQKKLGFECASASFYFDWTSENCYLSRFTRLKRPDIYVAERRQLVDYLELAPCMRRAWQHDDVLGAWSAWSTCDQQSLSRSRHRNCSSCPDKQETETAPCINKSSLMKEFPAIMRELETEPRNIALSLEAAKRFKPSTTSFSSNPDEASLFGEQDYNNQDEVSFFGPPEQSNTKDRQQQPQCKLLIGGQMCDPHESCCPQPTDLNAVARGCSVGFKILKDGKNVPCLPDSCQ